MTAIAGLVGVLSSGAHERLCRASLRSLSLYGSRTALRTTSNASFGVNLREILPEDRFDQQPYSDDQFLLVADIRLDNRAELLGMLGLGSLSSQIADAEILLQAWRRWQSRCLDLILGDYALAVFDNRSNTLLLARDPIGQRPLFYTRFDGAVFFASMPSGLLCHRGLEHDPIRITQRLAGKEDESQRSYFKGIERILSGETVVFSTTGIKRSRWSPRTDPIHAGTQEDLVGELREKLDRAVASRLRSTAEPIATQLSSGYDSSAVTATAAKLVGPSSLIAFTSAPSPDLETVSLRQRAADESSIAARTAHVFGIEHELVQTPEPLLDSLRDHTRYYQEPVRNVLNMSWWAEIDRRARERGATVLLTGEVGNLGLSAGGLSVLSEWIHGRDWRRWWAEAFAASTRDDVRWRGVLINSFRPWLPNAVNEGLVHLFQGQPRWSSACFARRELLHQLPPSAIPRARRPAVERWRILQGFDAGAFRKGSLAKHGIDERDPTSDRRLLEFTLRVPPEHLLSGGRYKPLAREALADRLPAFVLDAPVRGYQGADWVSRINKHDALNLLEEISANSIVHEVIDLRRLKEAIDTWPVNKRSLQIESFGRHLTNALAMGNFLVESSGAVTMGM